MEEAQTARITNFTWGITSPPERVEEATADTDSLNETAAAADETTGKGTRHDH